ncbi:hypothetical protein LguiB_000564 [Lonicera macranthoides]
MNGSKEVTETIPKKLIALLNLLELDDFLVANSNQKFHRTHRNRKGQYQNSCWPVPNDRVNMAERLLRCKLFSTYHAWAGCTLRGFYDDVGLVLQCYLPKAVLVFFLVMLAG